MICDPWNAGCKETDEGPPAFVLVRRAAPKGEGLDRRRRQVPLYPIFHLFCRSSITNPSIAVRLFSTMPQWTGMIHRVTVENMPNRYNRAVKHDHLVCRRCGSLTDISLEDLTASLREQLGEAFLSYGLKLFYLCPACREREKERGPGENHRKALLWSASDRS